MSQQLKAEHISDLMRTCIESCSHCHDVCTETLIHALTLEGDSAVSDLVRALLDCAPACDASRDFMLRGSDLHLPYCGLCAQACDRCADACERISGDDDVVGNCAEVCRRCAESCRAMSA